VELLVRDTCRLRPGLPGLSESITVTSVVGRFLEHSRVYYFKNGGDEEYFIGSADLMQGNLEHRVELLVPVEKPELRATLQRCLEVQLNDRQQSWAMQPDGSYCRRRLPASSQRISCHQQLIEDAEQRRLRALAGPAEYQQTKAVGITAS
jgi:polyphosphate kinase